MPINMRDACWISSQIPESTWHKPLLKILQLKGPSFCRSSTMTESKIVSYCPETSTGLEVETINEYAIDISVMIGPVNPFVKQKLERNLQSGRVEEYHTKDSVFDDLRNSYDTSRIDPDGDGSGVLVGGSKGKSKRDKKRIKLTSTLFEIIFESPFNLMVDAARTTLIYNS